MGNSVTRTDFEWVTQEEPHAKRRIEILSELLISLSINYQLFFIVLI